MYKVPCPSCGQVNNLGESDLGVTLNCGSCEAPFTYGTEIVAERKRLSAERKRQEKAEQAAIEEKNREAARAVRLKAEAEESERKRIAAEIQAKATEEEQHAKLMHSAIPTANAPELHRPAAVKPHQFDGAEMVAMFLNVFGILGIIGAIFGTIAAAMSGASGRGMSIVDALNCTLTFIGGLIMCGVAAAIRLLITIARNTAR